VLDLIKVAYRHDLVGFGCEEFGTLFGQRDVGLTLQFLHRRKLEYQIDDGYSILN
jgi:hypothetical protein